MSNKSVYVNDDSLWERAREIAGKAGLSSVVQSAIAEYVRRGELAAGGFKPFRLEVGYFFDADFDKERFSECLTFDGKLLVETRTRMMAGAPVSATPRLSPSDVLAEGGPYNVLIAVYLTPAKNLILTLDETGGNDTPIYYAVYDSLRALREDAQVKRLPPLERAGFLRRVAKELGEDWAIAID